ncbi:ABC transporter permease [Siculibacillus lacustris]|uniref:ABC transporter permease n=1 Tax=Siculibacillus lacustris TaxID=1549641 RepID=A0A4Q9VLM2_9HYPH|nr:ABC transporter permease [Siculibacillus lacustris]TBW35511.1 ABC transporter permease [Siculibacillus lacustris]
MTDAIGSRTDGSRRRFALAGAAALAVAAFTAFGFGDATGLLRSVAHQVPELGLLVLAMALPMMAGGINLAIVAIANLSAVATALAFARLGGDGLVAPLALAFGLAVGGGCGALIGALVAHARIDPVVASLGGLMVASGVGILVTNGSAVTGLPDFVAAAADRTVFGLPLMTLVFLAATALVALLVHRAPFGRRLSAVGHNAQASLYSGVDVARVHLTVYTLSGILSALAGLVMLSRFNSARMGYGDSYLLVTLLAAVLGGVDPKGGRGAVWATVAAILTLQISASGLNLLGASQHAASVAWGGILIAKLALDRIRA